MKTTLDIADDVLRAAEELAQRERKSAGEVISELARKALAASPSKKAEPEEFMGFRPFASRGGAVTNEQINDLRDKEIA